MSNRWPRFYVGKLTGYTERARRPSTVWYVYDRAYNCARFRGPYVGWSGQMRARSEAARRNIEHLELLEKIGAL